MEVKILQLHKRSAYKFKYIQDKFALDIRKTCFALSDGATQSYHSELWAEILTKEFVSEPTFNTEELIRVFTKKANLYKNFKFQKSNNPAKALIEETKQKSGGTATFLGVQFIEKNKLLLLSCGDSNLFILRCDKVLTFPFKNIDDLDKNQYFLNTEALLQNKVQKEFFQTFTLDLVENDIILLATDALSRLILTHPKVIKKIIGIKSFDEMYSFCLKHWDERNLQEDDISVIVISNNNKEGLREILPPSNFSFPKEVLPEFIPLPISAVKDLQINEYEMKEITTHLNHISQDLFELKRKSKLNQIFYLIAIGFFFLNVLLMIWIGFFKADETSSTISSAPVSNETNQLLNKLSAKVQSLENIMKRNQSKMDNLIIETKSDAALNKKDVDPKEEVVNKAKPFVKKDKNGRVINQQ